MTPVQQRTQSIRLLIADTHAMFSDALRRIGTTESDLTVVGLATNLEEAVQMTRELRPNVMLLNLAMRAGALDVLMAVCAASAGAIRTVVLAGTADQETAVRALQLGACGVISKQSATEKLFASIRKVSEGHYWIESHLMGDVMRAARRPAGPATRMKTDNRYGLTPREVEIVDWVTQGASNRSIATRCSITEDTVKHHLSNIFDKLGVYSRLELAIFAVHHRLVRRTATEGQKTHAVSSGPFVPVPPHDRAMAVPVPPTIEP